MRARATRVDVDAASTTGPKDPDAAGYAGPHAPPSTKTVLGRRVMIHHLTNPHGREFEVMTVRKTILPCVSYREGCLCTRPPPHTVRHAYPYIYHIRIRMAVLWVSYGEGCPHSCTACHTPETVARCPTPSNRLRTPGLE